MNGLLAEFADADTLLAATRAAREAGYTALDAQTPHAVDGLAALLATRRPRIGLAMLAGALFGGGGMLFMQWYASVVAYPINIGGRPDASWPLFVPPAAEMTLLFAGLAGVVAFLRGCRLPRLHHPLWDVDAFARASLDRYFLQIDAGDPCFDPQATRGFLEAQSALRVHELDGDRR